MLFVFFVLGPRGVVDWVGGWELSGVGLASG